MNPELPSKNHEIASRDLKSLSQEELINIVHSVSKKIYEGILTPEDLKSSTYQVGNSPYAYFPAEHYFESKTITSDMVDKLTQGGNLLSVGAGDGNLEIVLSESFGIPKKNIVVSDRDLTPEITQKGFRAFEFDMTKDWPDMSMKFDYILFPESLGVALMHIKGDRYSTRFFDMIERVTNKVLLGDHTPEDIEWFIIVIERDIPRVSVALKILKQAILRLKNGGEVRIKYGIDNDQQRAYLILKLKEEYPNISFPEPNQGSNFTLKM